MYEDELEYEYEHEYELVHEHEYKHEHRHDYEHYLGYLRQMVFFKLKLTHVTNQRNQSQYVTTHSPENFS